jgi:predicted O-methyltransferase YrrM
MKYWLHRISYLLRNRLVAKELGAHFRHAGTTSVEMMLPHVSIDDIAGTNEPVFIERDIADGNISSYELACICRIVRAEAPRAIFEIGTFNGRTTLHLAANTPPETRIWTLDLPPKDVSRTALRIKKGDIAFIDKPVSGVQFHGTEHEPRIAQIYADSASYDYSALNGTMDFVFVDGSHSYEYVINDTHVALKLLREGKGVILWHDYGWNEVIQALNEFFLNDSRFSELKNIKDTSFAYLNLR